MISEYLGYCRNWKLRVVLSGGGSQQVLFKHMPLWELSVPLCKMSVPLQEWSVPLWKWSVPLEVVFPSLGVVWPSLQAVCPSPGIVCPSQVVWHTPSNSNTSCMLVSLGSLAAGLSTRVECSGCVSAPCLSHLAVGKATAETWTPCYESGALSSEHHMVSESSTEFSFNWHSCRRSMTIALTVTSSFNC